MNTFEKVRGMIAEQLQVKAETTLYGVAVCFSLPEVTAGGTVSAEIIDSDGNMIEPYRIPTIESVKKILGREE